MTARAVEETVECRIDDGGLLSLILGDPGRLGVVRNRAWQRHRRALERSGRRGLRWARKHVWSDLHASRATRATVIQRVERERVEMRGILHVRSWRK